MGNLWSAFDVLRQPPWGMCSEDPVISHDSMCGVTGHRRGARTPACAFIVGLSVLGAFVQDSACVLCHADTAEIHNFWNFGFSGKGCGRMGGVGVR